MTRGMLKFFPPAWRDRYGDEFLEQFDADPRQIGKWVDALSTAAGLRQRAFRESGSWPAVVLVAVLTITLGCDLALGVGMDERIDLELLEHWWGAPFAAILAVGLAATTACFVDVLRDRQRRRSFVVLTGGIAAGSVAGSVILAAVSFDLAGVGAGAGLVTAVAVGRARLRTALSPGDGLLLAGVPMILILGWRTASSPVGPLILLTIAGTLLATRTPRRPRAA